MDWGKLIGPLTLAFVNGCALQAGADLRVDGEPAVDEAGFDTGAISVEDGGVDTTSVDATGGDGAPDTTVASDSLVSGDVLSDSGSLDAEPDVTATDSALALDSAVVDSATAGDTVATPDTAVVTDTLPSDTVTPDTVTPDAQATDSSDGDTGAATDSALEVQIFDAGPSLCAVDGDCPVGGYCRPVDGRLVCVNL